MVFADVMRHRFVHSVQAVSASTWLLCALLLFPTLWLTGVWTFDAVRVFAGLLLLGLLISPRLRNWAAPPLATGGERMVKAWLVAFFVLLVAHMLARVHLGLQGIDFAIFSQAIDGIARHGLPTVSLAAQARLDNFLWHHFCAVLYLPGALTWVGLPAPIAGILVHAAGAAVGFGALFATARDRLGPTVGWVVMLTAVLSAAVRPELFWGLHDETFALPFLGLGLWAWLQGRFGLASVAIALTATCKESFFPFVAWFAVVALVFHRSLHSPETVARARRALGPLIPLGVLATVGYFFLQPVLIGKTFDHLEKLASLDQLLVPRTLAAKCVFVFSVLLGSFGLGLLTPRGRIVLALALPFVGIVFVSGYDEMWRPFGYYALIPSVIGFFAAVVSLESLRVRWPVLVSGPALVLAVSLALSVKPTMPLRDVVKASREHGFSTEHLEWIPADARVVADPGAALGLLRVNQLRRLYSVSEQSQPLPFEYVVYRPGGYEPLSETLERLTVPCHPSGSWAVRCPR